MSNEMNEVNELAEEQLDDISGGTYLETADDAKRLLRKGIKTYGSELFGVPIMSGGDMAALRSALASFGVTIKDNGGIINANEYFIDGRKVSRDEAWSYINSKV